MIRSLHDSIVISENIARHLGIECPIRALYVEESLILAEKIRSALSMIPTSSYIVEVTQDEKQVPNLFNRTFYDLLLVNQNKQTQINHIEIYQCPLIIIPKDWYKLNTWKLAYTLDDVIINTLTSHSTSFNLATSNNSLVV